MCGVKKKDQNSFLSFLVFFFFILEFYPKTSRWKMVPLTQEKRMLSRGKDGKEGMIINGLWGFEF